MALAFGRRNFTAPHVARAMRVNLGFIPAVWADAGDVVIVDDVDYAVKAAHKAGKLDEKVLFLSLTEAAKMMRSGASQHVAIQPWGWDAALCGQLQRAGVPLSLLPGEDALQRIRTWSNRRTAVELLKRVRRQLPDTIGESFYCESLHQVEELAGQWSMVVVKAPWSCSGRGIRYMEGAMDDGKKKWIANIISQQGAVTLEPFYHKVIDLGMEFTACLDGTVQFDGLSLFHPENGAYMGNLISTEQRKRERLEKYVSSELLDLTAAILKKELASLFQGQYVGPLGIDMMVVAQEERFLLHPLVEMNLRRTMGHMALAFKPSPLEPERMMRVRDNVNFELQVKQLENAFVKVL